MNTETFSESNKTIIALALIFVAIAVLFVVSGAVDIKQADDLAVPSGGCVIFNEEYCMEGVEFDYLGVWAMGFHLPAGAEIRAPFDGIFIFPDSGGGLARSGRVDVAPKDGESGISLSFLGQYSPLLRNGERVYEGQPLGTLVADEVVEDIYGTTFVVIVQGIDEEGLSYNDPELVRGFFTSSE